VNYFNLPEDVYTNKQQWRNNPLFRANPQDQSMKFIIKQSLESNKVNNKLLTFISLFLHAIKHYLDDLFLCELLLNCSHENLLHTHTHTPMIRTLLQ